MNDMGTNSLNGVLCHDHWKPCYRLNCTDSLCNAHHFSELRRFWEQDDQQWAEEMIDFLETVNIKVKNSGSSLNKVESLKYRKIILKFA